MKKILISVCLMMAVFLPLAAEGATVDSVLTSLTSRNVTTGNFIQEKYSAKLKKPLKSSGSYVFCRDGIVWQTLKPFKSSMTITQTSLIQVKADGSKTVIDGSANEVFRSVANTVSSLFSGTRTELEAVFKIDSFTDDKGIWNMALTPKDATIASALKRVEIGGKLTGNEASLDSMTIAQSDTESTKYTLKDQNYKKELSDVEKALFK